MDQQHIPHRHHTGLLNTLPLGVSVMPCLLNNFGWVQNFAGHLNTPYINIPVEHPHLPGLGCDRDIPRTTSHFLQSDQ